MLSIRYRIKRTRVWLLRFFHLKGNGVHSPFAFDFICQVVNNTSQYYAYSDLALQLKAMSLQQRKQAKLLFRLSNNIQPEEIILPEAYSMMEDFVRAGCRKATVRVLSLADATHTDLSAPQRRLIIAASPAAITEDIHTRLSPNSLIAVFDIRKSRSLRQQWRDLTTKPCATLTFDLYSLGLILYKPGFFKHHYIINF